MCLEPGKASDKISVMEDEIQKLHSVLESQGINSRGECDVNGTPFKVPVDNEHKAKVFTSSMLLTAGMPHMYTFWAATIGFCTSFFSVFAPAALGPYLRMPTEDGGLGLDRDSASLAGNLSLTSAIVMRILAGPLCDLMGARKTFVVLLMLGIPGMIVCMTAQGAGGIVAGRFIMTFSLGTFVTCQVWCSQFFAPKIVGTVNATAGGWGNLGGGITLLLMPQIMEIFMSMTDSSMSPRDSISFSWRICFVIPMALHCIAAVLVWFGRDLADGSYAELERRGLKQKSAKQGGGFHIVKVGFSNTNALILAITYGLCFGVELCMNNKMVDYFNRYYGIAPRNAGVLGALFSLMNLFARSWGGMLSDYCNKLYGMRGRLTSMWIIQTLCGLMCLLLGLVTLNMDNVDEQKFVGAPQVRGVYVDGSGIEDLTYYINGTLGMVDPCGSSFIRSPMWAELNGQSVRFPMREGSRFMLKDPNPDCIHNGNTLGVTVLLVLVFSILVQMAEGLHFGVVPKVNRPAMGVVSGMVGAGGNFGGFYTGQFVVGSGVNTPIDQGFIWLGIVIMCGTLVQLGLFFPGEGGIFLPKNFGYDPQWIKPLEGSKGSDEIDFSKSKTVEVNPADVQASSQA